MEAERVALVIGHADEAELLERNLRHHLGMGASRIVVSIHEPDAETADIVARFANDGVTLRVLDFALEDPFDYFSLAANDLRGEGETGWIGFIDTDEFIVSTSRSLRFPDRPQCELYAIPRYNAVVQRLSAGTLMEPRLDMPDGVVVAVGEKRLEDLWAHGDNRLAYSDGIDVSAKVFARARLTEKVTLGGHGIATAVPFVERAVARGMAIVHAPFTTLNRFRKKAAQIRHIYETYPDRLPTWHWPYWAKMDDDELATEFEKQIFGEGTHHETRTATIAEVIAEHVSDSALPLPREWYMLQRVVDYVDTASTEAEPAAERIAAETIDKLTYLARYSDLAAMSATGNFDTIHHFAAHGLKEGRSPAYQFELSHISKELNERLGTDVHPREVWWLYLSLPEEQRFTPNSWFDAAWFRAKHPGIAPDGDWAAFRAYRRNVCEQALSPNAWFDEAAAREQSEVGQAVRRGIVDSAFHVHYASICAGRNPLDSPQLV